LVVGQSSIQRRYALSAQWRKVYGNQVNIDCSQPIVCLHGRVPTTAAAGQCIPVGARTRSPCPHSRSAFIIQLIPRANNFRRREIALIEIAIIGNA